MISIEWLIDQLPLIQQEGLRDVWEQAKEMHKKEVINAWYNGYINQSPMIDEENCGEQFYQETFKKD